MCRLLVFSGSCTRCGESHTWDDLAQRLACLEAKNNDAFDDCDAGVFVEHHDFDQECDHCADEDEGVGDVDEEGAAVPAVADAGADAGSGSGSAPGPASSAGKRVADADGDARKGHKKQKT